MATPLDLDAKKTVLRQFSYGLYAVTAAHNGDRGVFTANWLTQVSFDPPLVAVSVELDSATLPLIRGSGRFAISPFSSEQKDLAGALGRPKSRAGDKFASSGLEIYDTTSDIPVLDNLLGYVVCKVVSVCPAGDSEIIVGEVIESRVLHDGEPLTMRAAGFRHAG